MTDTSLKPAVLLWVLIDDALKMPQGKVPQTWYTDYNDIADKRKFVQVIVPCDYFTILQDKRHSLEMETKDLLL